MNKSIERIKRLFSGNAPKERREYRVAVYDEMLSEVREFRTARPGSVVDSTLLKAVLCGVSALVLAFAALYAGEMASHRQSRAEYDRMKCEMAEMQARCDLADSIIMESKLHHHIGKYALKPNSKVTDEKVYELLVECEAWYPDITFAQAVQESSMGRRVPDCTSNNLIGMFYPTQRETTACGKTESGYAVYKNWQLCILDKVKWDYVMFNHKKPTREEYVRFIDAKYSEDSNYVSKLDQIIKTRYSKVAKEDK